MDLQTLNLKTSVLVLIKIHLVITAKLDKQIHRKLLSIDMLLCCYIFIVLLSCVSVMPITDSLQVVLWTSDVKFNQDVASYTRGEKC